MATLRLATFVDEIVVIEADYHDQNRRIQRVRCINNGTASVLLTVIDDEDGSIVAELTLGPGTHEENVSQGKQVTVDELGNDNFPYRLLVQYPAPGG